MEQYIEARHQVGRNNYVLIDEVQMCSSFEKAINSLHAKERYDIWVTGSNAFLQSSDLATLFVGRTYEVHIFPFSFSEYLTYYPAENLYGSLSSYVREGGMAGSYLYRNEAQKYRYINTEVLNALIVRDIMTKYHFRNEPLLHELIDFLMDNIGNVTSVRTIAQTLASGKKKTDHKTIGKYIDALCKAFAFYRIRRYDIRGKRYLRSEDKYYLTDHSFRFARLGTKNMDYGRVLENIVAMELLRRGYEVYVGVLYQKEIDFVAIRQGEKLYIEHMDDGSGTERIVQSGLRDYLKPEELIGQHVIIAANLAPRKMRGVESHGMLLAADYMEDGKEKVELLTAPWAKPGTPVVLEGADPAAEKPAKIDIDKFCKVEIKIQGKTAKIAGISLCADGKPLTTQKSDDCIVE